MLSATSRRRSALGGGIALISALALPPLLLVGLGAVWLQAMLDGRARAQETAAPADVGAPEAGDPFATLNIENAGLLRSLGCTLTQLAAPKVMVSSNSTIAAGNHCSDFEVMEGVTATLAPGEHYFVEEMKLTRGARLIGDDVVLIFGPAADPNWQDGASVALSGRRSGRLAGFVIVASRLRADGLRIRVDSVDALTGTIYAPGGAVSIEGRSPAR